MKTFYFVREPDHMIECSDCLPLGANIDIIKQKHKIFETKKEAESYQSKLRIASENEREILNKWFAEAGLAEEYGYIAKQVITGERLAEIANYACDKVDKEMEARYEKVRRVYGGEQWSTEFECPEGYIFKDQAGNEIHALKIVLEKKKKEYPKTYKECCDVLGLSTMDNDAQGYKWELIIRFQELFIARDAYWKIAGEEMGLGKPWEPDWTNLKCDKFCILVEAGDISLKYVLRSQHILAFPSSEMRDAFYENFKELINQCKELL